MTTQTGFTFGLSLTSAVSTGLMFSVAPVWVMVIGSSFGQECLTRRGVAGVVLSIVGVGAVFSEGLSGGGSGLAGNLCILLAAVGVGAYSVLSMPLLERYTSLAAATYPILFGGQRSCCSCPRCSS